MIWDELDFIVRETAIELRRERLIAIATISTVAVLFLILGAIVLFHLDLRVWTDRMAGELEVWGYFAKDVSRTDARRTARDISSWPEVESAQFVPKEEGLKKLRSYLSGSAALRDIGNPLPDGVCINVRDPRDVSAVARMLSETRGVRDVVPSPADTAREDGLVSRVVKAKLVVSWAGVIIAALVALAGVLIVHNTIRLALHARWREIYIMQLVGATRAFIAAPFLLQGIVHGLLGAAISGCLLIPAHMYLRSLSAHSTPFFLLLPDTAMLPFGLYLLLAGAVLGLTGSLVSIRRFLTRRPEWRA